MTTVRSPRLDCLPAALNSPQDAQQPFCERAVGARKGDAEGVLSALRPNRRGLRPLRSSREGRTTA